MASSTFSVDWRQTPPLDTIVENLHRVLSNADENRQVVVVRSNTTAKGIVQLHEARGSEPRMYRQKKKTTVWPFPKSLPPYNSKQNKYPFWVVYITEELMKKIDASATIFKRNLLYELAAPSRSLGQAKVEEVLKDLALTCGLHPYALGLRIESTGQVRVPAGVRLRLGVVDNLLVQGNRIKTRILESGVHPIPQMVDHLKIETIGRSIRAVVVTEHRNIKDMLNNFENDPPASGFQGILLVMTGGYPDGSVREFLHQLSNHHAVKNLPFLWVSDCDPDGILQYAVCKFGSRATAWASPTMVCPQLQFAGLSHALYQDYVSKFVDRNVAFDCAHQALAGIQVSEVDKQRLRAEAQKQADAALKALSKPVPYKTRQAWENRFKAVGNAGFLTPASEIEARDELKRLENGGRNIPLSAVNEFDPHGVAFLIRDVVAGALGAVQDDAPVFFTRMGPLRQQFLRQLNSQGPIHSQSSLPATAQVVTVAQDFSGLNLSLS